MNSAARSVCCALVLAALFVAIAAASGDEVPATPDPGYAFAPVQSAFEADGEDGVKDWMRAMLKRNKKAGIRLPSTGKKLKCGSCHESLSTYELSANASTDLQALLDQEAAASESGD